MARKKTTKKRSPRRRRAMGSVAGKYSDELSMVIGGAIGLLAGRVLPYKIAPNADKRMVSGLTVVGGIVGAQMFTKTPFVRNVMLGAAGAGAIDLATNMGWLPSAAAVGSDEILLDLGTTVAGGWGSGRGSSGLLAGNYQTPPFSFVDNTLAGAMAGLH